MKKNFFSLLLFCFILIFNAFPQNEEIILTIGDQQITRDEFERIYHKNNSSAVYDNKDVNEYIDMFINFKLKVIEAEALGYDTVKAFINELSGYRDQLAKPYLEAKEVTENLVREAYYRTANQASASHILIRLDPNAATADTIAAYNKIMDIRKRILSGEPFDKVADETSDDKGTKGGYLGWFSAFRMIYEFEDVAYKTPVGQISMPFRSQFGYHILKNEGIRPSPGKVRIAHILILAQEDSAKVSKKAKLDECYNKLKQGENFAELVKFYSEDERSASRGGELGWFGSEAFHPNMEGPVFALKDSGDFTEPIEMEYGWHIFQILGKNTIEPFDKLKPEIEKKIFNDTRSNKVNSALIQRIKNENNFREYKENLNPLISLIDQTIYDGTWDASIAESLVDPVFSFGNKDYLQSEFAQFVSNQKRLNKNLTISELVNKEFGNFVNEKALEYEKQLLEEKYPDFRNLMREYHDGILLFNLTDDMVWSKAVKDTAGLKKFYELNKEKYMWGERADISTYSFEDKKYLKKLLSVAKKRSKSFISQNDVNKKVTGIDTLALITVHDLKIEKEDTAKYNGIEWKAGTYILNEVNGKSELIYVNKLIAPESKKLEEAKGLITADYQTYLESEWIKSLREKYKFTVNEEVLKKVK